MEEAEKEVSAINLRTYFKFPLRVDAYGIYVFDANSNMVADNVSGHIDARKRLCVCVAALHKRLGHGETLNFYWPDLKPPFSFEAEEDIIQDANGEELLRIRGWGRLQYSGVKLARQVQEALAAEIVAGLNEWYKENAASGA